MLAIGLPIGWASFNAMLAVLPPPSSIVREFLGKEKFACSMSEAFFLVKAFHWQDSFIMKHAGLKQNYIRGNCTAYGSSNTQDKYCIKSTRRTQKHA